MSVQGSLTVMETDHISYLGRGANTGSGGGCIF